MDHYWWQTGIGMNRISAEPLTDNTCFFSVWAPEKEHMILHIIDPPEQEIIMSKNETGYFSAKVEGIRSGCRYFYKPDGGKDLPDPASHFQPEGVHGPSQVVDHTLYNWSDQLWRGIPISDLILYEIHTGTFSAEGTFEAIIPFLEEIAATGINAIELMPVSQFPGTRNWGYDGVYPYSVHNSYGGPEGLKRLVDACHSRGIAVLLDVVYNHQGPEGNYFGMFAPYHTARYQTPWGDAINLDDAWCDGVREFYSANPVHWSVNYHIDGLRFDAIHMVFDNGAVHLWELIHKNIKKLEQKTGRRFYLIAESDLNSPRVVKLPESGGFGFDATWLDDFHHALYGLLDKQGNQYDDFGRIEQLAKAYTDGFVFSGELFKLRKRRHGASSAGIPGDKFVVFNQNHDQIGNRVKGERLSTLIGFESLKLASAALLLSPYIPLFFMGEEYGEDNPFYYFVSHTDEELIKAVQEGRKKEFEAFKWQVNPPDPQDELTFDQSKISWQKRTSGKYRIMLAWNKKLISLRRLTPSLESTSKNDIRVYINHDKGLILHRKSEDELQHVLCFLNFADTLLYFNVPSLSGTWIKILDSKEKQWLEEINDDDNSAPGEILAQQTLAIQGCSAVVYSNTGF